MKNPDRVRSTGSVQLTLILAATVVAPFAMMVAFPWVTRPMIERVLHSAIEAAQPAEASAAKPMVFEPTVITLAEADATVATACAATPVPSDFVEACAELDRLRQQQVIDAANGHWCTSATDEAGTAKAPRFVPVCDQEVGPIGDLAVTATTLSYHGERGIMPFDVAEAMPPMVATYR